MLNGPITSSHAKRIDEEIIRAKFGGTLFPPVTITVEPLEEAGVWWAEVLHDVSEYKGKKRERYLRPWRAMIQWFRDTPELICPVFVRIGDYWALVDVPQDHYPDGTEITGSVLPRLAVGLSQHGSLIGICGYSVQT